MGVFRTVSPRAGFGGEALVARVEDGRLTGIAADPKDRFTRGRLTPFGRRYPQRVYSKERLVRPLRRTGSVGSGDFEPISWEEALDEVAGALARTIDEHDPRAVLYYAGRGKEGVLPSFLELLLALAGGYSTLHGDLCNAAGREATRLTFGSLRHHPPEDLVHARNIVLWGRNAAVTHPHLMPFLERAREAGAQLLCVDPVRTKTAEFCDEHVAPKPGTDGFLANAIGHVLVAEGLVDEEFVDAHVLGFDEYRELVRHYEPKKAESVCGVERDVVVALARRLAAARPGNFQVGYGVQRYRNGGQTVRAIAALQAVLGNIGVPGGGFDFFNLDAYVARPFPFDLPRPPRVRQLDAVSRFGRTVLGAEDPPVKAALIECGNPMAQSPFASAIHYALARLDFVCVVDQFLTDTARRAHVVLPATSMFEELDLVPGPWDGVLRLRPKCLEPPNRIRSGRAIGAALARRLDLPGDQFEIPREEMLDKVLPAGLSVNRLRKQPFARRKPGYVPYADKRFKTPSGRIELKSELAEIAWRVDPLPYYAPPRESVENDPERFKRFPLHLITPKTEHRYLSQWAHDEALRKRDPTAVRLNPVELRKRELQDGDTVRVFNERGEARLPVRADDAVREGVAVVPQGRWISLDGFSVNVLTHDDVTDMGYGAIFFDCLVQVEKAPETERRAE